MLLIKTNCFSFRTLAWAISGLLAAIALLFALSLPEKYAITLALGVAVSPLVLIVTDKGKLLIGAFILSLPLFMGLQIMQRLVLTNSSVPFLFQLWLSDIFLISFILVWFLKYFADGYNSQCSIWRSRMVIPLILWIGTVFLSLIPAIDRTVAFVVFARMLRVALTFFCVFQFVKGRRELRFILSCLLLALLLQALLMFVQHATGSLMVDFSGSQMSLDAVEQGLRPTGTMGHSSHYAKFSGLVLPLVLAYIFFAPKMRHRFLMLAICVCGSVALVLTISRAGLAAWLLSMLLFAAGVIVLRIAPVRRTAPLLVICALLISISACGMYLIGGQRLKSRMKYDASATVRIPMWKVALNVIKAHPITGVGAGNYILVHQDYDNTREHISVAQPYSPVHNLYLLYAAEIGIPGLLFFLWFIWELLRCSVQCASYVKSPIDKAIYLCMAIGVMNILLQSVTGMGVTNGVIHLSAVAIFAACVAKHHLLLTHHQLNGVN